MRKFIEMIEAASRTGILNFRAEDFAARIEDILGTREQGDHIEDFMRYAEQARTFVFTPKTEKVRHPSVTASPDIEDPPFPVFSIELAGESYTCVASTGNKLTDIICILVAEYAPKRFVYYLLVQPHGMGTDTRGIVMDFSPQTASIVREFIERMNTEKMGLERTRHRVTLNSAKNKRRHTIREVIHIAPTPKKVETYGTRDIDWTHRFEVRGHWRVSQGIGKDRSGNYCVEGYTWVKEHVRGPDELPFVKKQRIVQT